jgi:hypothetical protein
MEETMQVLTINELMRLTRIELCGLYTVILCACQDIGRAPGDKMRLDDEERAPGCPPN